MNRTLLMTILTILCASCGKVNFKPDHPDVGAFVRELKNGTYDCYEKGDNGEDLWLLMPEFTSDQIQSLIDFSKDTTHISNFPVNPISSRTPFPNGRDYFILSECLLWTVEGIRNGSGFGSLDPYLTDTQAINQHAGLNGAEILIVRAHYQTWWNSFKNTGWAEKNPLEGTSYHWF